MRRDVINPPALVGAVDLAHWPPRLGIAVAFVVLALVLGAYLAGASLFYGPGPATAARTVASVPAPRPVQVAHSQSVDCGVGISGDLVGEHGNPAEVQAASLALCASVPQP